MREINEICTTLDLLFPTQLPGSAAQWISRLIDVPEVDHWKMSGIIHQLLIITADTNSQSNVHKDEDGDMS